MGLNASYQAQYAALTWGVAKEERLLLQPRNVLSLTIAMSSKMVHREVNTEE